MQIEGKMGNSAPREWRLWRTITLGTFLSTQDLFAALKQAGFANYLWTDDIVGKLNLVDTVRTIELFLVTPEELGIDYGCDYLEIRTEAMRQGFRIVPTEGVAQLRLAYNNQPKGERLQVGTVTFPFKGKNRALFCITHNEQGMQLTVREPGEYFKKNEKFVFCR